MAIVSVTANAELSESEALFGSEMSVSIATGALQPLRTAPAVATVITAEQIRNYGFRSAVEALNLVPGFHLALPTTLNPDVLVRGFSGLNSSNVLILLDGISFSEKGYGNQLAVLGKLPLDAIARIEVTRGPGSSLFGADAFSAVVNIITKRKTEKAHVEISGGSYQTFDGRMIAGDSGDFGDIVVSAEMFESDGYAPRIKVDNISEFDQSVGMESSLAPGNASTSKREVGALINYTRDNTRAMLRYADEPDWGTGIGAAGVLDPDGTTSSKTLQARLVQAFDLVDSLSVTLTADAVQYTASFDSITIFPPSPIHPKGVVYNAESTETSWKARADFRYDAIQGHDIAFGGGLDYSHYRMDSVETNYGLVNGFPVPVIPGFIDPVTSDQEQIRRVPYVYVQDSWVFAPRWSLTVGARFDDYSDVGSQFSPRAVLVWAPRPEWTTKLLYGEGFRAPSLLETGNLALPVYEANPDLKPERLETLEFFVGYSPSPDLDVGLNIYRHRTRDQIRQQNPEINIDYRVTPENIGDQVGDGGEIEVNWQISKRWMIGGWYAYQYNTDKTSDKDVGYSPHHRAFASLQYSHGPVFGNLRANYIGDRARVAEDLRDEPDDYYRLDLLGRYTFSGNLSVQADVRNLLNSQDYEPAPGTSFPQDLPLPGRNYYVTLQITF